MKRFFLGIMIGILAVSAFWNDCAGPSRPSRALEPVAAQTVLVAQRDPNEGFPPVRDERESVGDIPVPIVPGTRVTEAQVRPPQPRVEQRRASRPSAVRSLRHAIPAAAASAGSLRVITGRLSATDERARDDVRQHVDHAVREWLGPAVSSAWTLPEPLRAGLVKKTEVRTVPKEIEGEHVTMFEASQTVDFSPVQRTALIDAYHREVVTRRLAILAGVIAFVLVCLAALTGYIRADEATKGYYTNRLRLVSAAGAGTAGVVIYRLLA